MGQPKKINKVYKSNVFGIDTSKKAIDYALKKQTKKNVS